MTNATIKRKQLRDRIATRKPLVIPGASDGLGARLIQDAGFEAAYMSGFAVEGTYGFPDVGLLTLTEMVARAEIMAGAIDIPLICDADTGYGNAMNVQRTVREYERAGVCAIQIEDQALPKKCGSMSGKRLVSIDEMCGKIRAAVDAREDENFQIIGRTDAVAVEGFDAAIRRIQAYVEAGADMTMVLGPYTPPDVKTFADASPKPLVHLNSESVTVPMLSTQDLQASGVYVSILPLALLLTAAKAMQHTLSHIKEYGCTTKIMKTDMVRWSEFNEIMGLPAVYSIEDRYAAG
jgi:2,3-dimethylmalate lyase